MKKYKDIILFVGVFLFVAFLYRYYFFDENKNEEIINNEKNFDYNIQNSNVCGIYYPKKTNYLLEGVDFNFDIEEKEELFGVGNGFVITGDYIITNKHVLESDDFNYIVLDNQGKKINIENIWYITGSDLAILKINNKNLDNVDFVKTGIKIGDDIYIVSKNFELDRNVLYKTIISAQNVKFNVLDSKFTGYYLINLTLDSGASGSPVYNKYGEVIGIVSAVDNNGYSYVLPLNIFKIKKIINSLKL